jgi:hypothetical protein
LLARSFYGSASCLRLPTQAAHPHERDKAEGESLIKLSTLEDLFVHELRDIFNAEQQLTKALPKMAKAASAAELSNGFTEHLEETKEQVKRLEKIFAMLELPARGRRCAAMEGLIEEGQELMSEDAEDAVKDAALIAAAQKVEPTRWPLTGHCAHGRKSLGTARPRNSSSKLSLKKGKPTKSLPSSRNRWLTRRRREFQAPEAIATA